MSAEIEFAAPQDVRNAADCFFYHVMDLPGTGVVGEQWDLRKTIDAYLGHFEFRGRRALDVGTASGYLTFEMEKRGAEVVSFDLADGADWNVVPFHIDGFEASQSAQRKKENIARLHASYWFAHRVLGSRAKAFYGDVYRIPQELGPFDVVVLGAILLHLRDPFLALQSAGRLSRDAIVVTDMHFASTEPVMRFVPDRAVPGSADTWWLISEPCMVKMLEVLGFEVESVTRQRHLVIHQERRELLFSTYVGHRRAQRK